MAKQTYELVGWKSESEGNTPVSPTNLRHMDEAIKYLYDKGATSKDIFICGENQTIEDAPEEAKLVFENNKIYIKNELEELKEVILQPSGDTLPIGAFAFIGTETAPTGWLRADGQAVSRTEYAELFNVFGTTFGAGDGSTTFNLPNVNLENRTLIGASGDGEFSIGNTMGEKEHTLTISEMPSHNHGIQVGWTTGDTDSIFYNKNNATNNLNTKSQGGGQPHNNMQPSIAMTCIIKAKQSAGLVGSVTDDINDVNDNAVANAKTVKEYIDKISNGTVLFSGEGENENLSLNENASNFTYLEIFARVGSIYTSVKVYQPNGKRFSLVEKTSETSLLQLDCCTYLINGTQITLIQGQRINLGNEYLKPWDASNIYITRVVGYE